MFDVSAKAWVVDGGPIEPRPHPAVRFDRLGPVSDEKAEWSDLTRAQADAARADSCPVRVAVGDLGTGQRLVVVVTTAGREPGHVLDWLLDPAVAWPAEEPVAHRRTRAAAVELPPELRDGGAASGSATTVRRPGGSTVDEVAAAAGVSADAVLAAAVSVLLAGYRGDDIGDRFTDLARAQPIDASISVRRERALSPRSIGVHTATEVRIDDGVADHALTIALTDDGLCVDHDAGMFSPEAVTVFIDRLAAVLDLIADDPLVRDLSILTAAEHEAIAGWSRGESWLVPDECLHTLIERHARTTPDAIAVACGSQELSYRELDHQAARVANVLVARGAGRGDLVAVIAERAVESITAMVGVLKAGAAYVPIEPSYPDDRRRRIVADAGARIALVRTGIDTALGIASLALDALPDVPEAPAREVHPDDLAYVIYTSGSTGVPKGVAVPHRAVVVSTYARGIGGPPPECDIVTMPLCFDGAAGGLYWTLTGGGTVVLPTETEAHDPIVLSKLLRAWPPTHIHSVPSHYELVLQIAAGHGLEGLKLASVGGEPMPSRLVARHLLDCPEALLLNDYGPTECAVWASAHRCTALDATRDRIPIGKPLPNYRLHVLDAHLRPVAPGLPGEIYIGGPAVAWGYHARPALTAQRFVPDPFGGPSDRLYRTGDRGRWTADGDLHITGRVDNQVKLRGFRVELGEIEAAVKAHRSVIDCVVTVRAATSGADMVTAFVVSRDSALDDNELRTEVARSLPAYMHPDRFVVLPDLPRAASGKLDMAALRALAAP